MIWMARSKPREKDIKMPDVRLESSRVFIRPPLLEDWPQWARVRSRNRNHLTPFEPKWPDRALDKDYWAEHIARQTKYWQEGRGYYFLVFDKENYNLIGGVNLNNVARGAAQYASAGYWIDEDCQGKGLMRESLQLVFCYAFEVLKLHRINASCIPHNEKSVNLLKRLGFTEEGFARNYIKINGKWEDHMLFGLNAEDFII
jgi:ribosomal-protein-alanine N-acetyltransferase